MKNIIIGGTVRAGKTTLANRIVHEFGYSKMESDTIVNAFDKALPEIGILHRTPEKTRKIYEPFLHEILNGINKDLKYSGIATVFPGSQFMPENLKNYKNKNDFIIIFLGVNAPSPEALFAKIRENDTLNDWTHKQTDEWLLSSCKNILLESEELKKQCKENGFYYFNTFENRECVITEILELIKKEQ